MTDKRYEYTIYKICSDECGEFYIGSTRNMVQRKKNHKSMCNNPKTPSHNTKIYRTIRDNGGWDAFRMVPLELMENTTKFEAECREEVVRCELQALLNTRKASRGNMTREEIIDYKKEYDKEYRKNKKCDVKNIKTILESIKKNDCECGGQYTHINKARHLTTQKHQLYLDSLEKET